MAHLGACQAVHCPNEECLLLDLPSKTCTVPEGHRPQKAALLAFLTHALLHPVAASTAVLLLLLLLLLCSPLQDRHRHE